jgi:hypothetical protein
MARVMRRIPSVTICVLLVPLLAGCAFDRKWRHLVRTAAAAAAAADHDAPHADPLAGRWEGRWVSQPSGHSGKLRAIITRIPQTSGGGESYRAEFAATFLGILRFDHGTNLTALPAPSGVLSFEGQENLGALAGGIYRYHGTADGRTFDAAYESKNDHGRFQMKRPAR